MPKISAKKQERSDQIAKLQSSKTNQNPYNHFATAPYPRTGLTLVLGLDGTLWKSFKRGHIIEVPEVPPYLRDFLHFCQKACEDVIIFTDRLEDDAVWCVDKLIGDVTKNIIIRTEANLDECLDRGVSYYHKVLSAEEFNPERTLIIDNIDSWYVTPQRDNLMVAQPSEKDFEWFYLEVISFLTSYKPQRSLPSQINKFCQDSLFLSLPKGWNGGFFLEKPIRLRKKIKKV